MLAPPPYLRNLRDTLRQLEPGLFRWFGSTEHSVAHADQVRVELLKATYRMPEPAHPALYQAAGEVARLLEVTVPVTLYQAQDDGTMNAGLFFVPGEVHIVLRGPVLDVLSPGEVRALLGHEIGHYKLWDEEEGTYRRAHELIEHIVSSPRAAPSHMHSAIRLRRWVELYADRASLVGCGDLRSAVGCLLKVTTGLTSADPDAYLLQAQEVLSKAVPASESAGHPESFIRAHALKLWSDGGERCDVEVRTLIDGVLGLETLDLVQQVATSEFTRQLIAAVLGEPWFRTQANLNHAQRFFPDVEFVAGRRVVDALSVPVGLAEYSSYVLLDFAVIDPELETVALAHVAKISQELGIEDTFEKIARKELKLTVKAYRDIESRAEELVEKARSQAAEVVA